MRELPTGIPTGITLEDLVPKLRILFEDVYEFFPGTPSIEAKTSNYALTSDDYLITVNASNADIILTLPSVETCSGYIARIKKIDGSGLVTVDAGSGVYIDSDEQYLYMVQKRSFARLISDGKMWHIIGST